MKPFIETCREYEAAAGIYGPGLAASGRAPVDDFGATANAEKQLRIELAGRLIAKYWTERHAVLEADVRSLMRGAEEGNLEGMAEALVDYLDCDGEISAVSADAIAALGASASAYMKSYAGLEKSA